MKSSVKKLLLCRSENLERKSFLRLGDSLVIDYRQVLRSDKLSRIADLCSAGTTYSYNHLQSGSSETAISRYFSQDGSSRLKRITWSWRIVEDELDLSIRMSVT